ncbi:MAG: transcriptional repressor [Endomicrobia bacterium]|nr:transcriptional repressor [Endomicrobiia bacterium]
MDTKEILSQKGLRPTIQRIKVYEYLLTHRTHPDVENIYKDLKKEIPTISRTTIYNTLKELVKNGLILEIPTEYKLCFDGYTQKHSHFICEMCEKIFDLDLDLKFKENKISGHIIKSFCVMFKGICINCQRKEKK